MNTYRFEGGQIFFGGGLDVSVEASSREEAIGKIRAAIAKIDLGFNGHATVDGVRCEYDVTVSEAFMGNERGER